jgi:prepilin-type N-terminal cleavage/methylation domain-containing protein
MWDRMIEKRNEGGFTLIELLIVIIILAILAAIVVFAVGTTGANAKAAACSADAKSFETALESYKAEIGMYPGFGTGNQAPTGTSSPNYYGLTGNGGAQWQVNGLATNPEIGPFMRSLPLTTHYEILTDGNGGVFVLPAVGNTTGPATYGGTPPNSLTAAWLDSSSATVANASTLPGASSDNKSLNFDTNPNICADTAVVS